LLVFPLSKLATYQHLKLGTKVHLVYLNNKNRKSSINKQQFKQSLKIDSSKNQGVQKNLTSKVQL
jgi:hypothetical protein